MVDLRWAPFVILIDGVERDVRDRCHLADSPPGHATLGGPPGLACRHRWLLPWQSASCASVRSSLHGPTPATGIAHRHLGESYPSWHAIAAAVTAIGIVMAFTTARRRLRWMTIAVAVAAAVALSRPICRPMAVRRGRWTLIGAGWRSPFLKRSQRRGARCPPGFEPYGGDASGRDEQHSATRPDA